MGIELLFNLGHLRLIVSTRTRIVAWRELFVLDVNGGLKDFASSFRTLKVTNGGSFLSDLRIWIVKSRSNSVEATACIHVLVDFLGGDRGRLERELVHLILVLVSQVLCASLV